MNCPLCSGDCAVIAHNRWRMFIMCENCTLVSVPEMYHLSVDQERQRYSLHDNTARNDGYVRFLGEVADIIDTYAAPEARILDYGCGKNAVLTDLLVKRGRRCDPFDPLYEYPLETDSDGAYDIVIMCEVIEHCRNLRAVLDGVRRLLTPSGAVVVRTQLYPSHGDIARWWYAQDLTHVNLFSWKAVEEAAALLGRSAAPTVSADIFVIRK
jgi:hypothetical protein